MTGNIIGEPFDEFVANQINVRQFTQFAGYGTSLRNTNQLQYLTNRNAWVKLASSVNVLPNTNAPLPTNTISSPLIPQLTPQQPVLTSLQQPQSTRLIELGESKLTKIGITDPSNYLDSKLAEKAVLFNTISE